MCSNVQHSTSSAKSGISATADNDTSRIALATVNAGSNGWKQHSTRATEEQLHSQRCKWVSLLYYVYSELNIFIEYCISNVYTFSPIGIISNAMNIGNVLDDNQSQQDFPDLSFSQLDNVDLNSLNLSDIVKVSFGIPP